DLGPGAPDAAVRGGRGLDDPGGRPDRAAVEELADPVLVVLRPGPLDRRAVVRLDDADGAARQHDRSRRRQDVAGRKAAAGDALADQPARGVLVHEPEPGLARRELVRVGDERTAAPVECEPAEAEQAALR